MTATTLTSQTFAAGDIIVKKGDESTTAYLIDSGKVLIYLEEGDKVVDLATLGEDEIFGETALFTGAAYGANVKALEDTELTLITPEILAVKMKGCDPLLRSILQMLIERLDKTNKALVESETREFIDVAFV